MNISQQNQKTKHPRYCAALGIAVAITGVMPVFAATTEFNLTPLNLFSTPSINVTVTGKLFTDGTTGLLSTSNIKGSDVNIKTSATDVFDNTNSANGSVGVAATSTSLIVDHDLTNPECCRSQSFIKGPLPHFSTALTLAAFNTGDQASYSARIGNIPSVSVPLTSLDPNFVAATGRVGTSGVFEVKPIDFGGGVTAFGSITTDGTLGAANITAWDPTVQFVDNVNWQETNITLSAGINNVMRECGWQIDVRRDRRGSR